MSQPFDVFVVGGGINGCGIARDAAGRGMRVALAEMGDLAQATSSASTKLFHGGLRYLEYYEFRLVREALMEREVLLKAMPHISWPLRFVLPHHKGLRPAWLLRLGLFIYDHLGGRKILPPTKSIGFAKDITGRPLKKSFTRGFEYSDCWVEDSRLVALNARDAELRGAEIMIRTKVLSAERKDDVWNILVENVATGEQRQFESRSLVNAGGPWVEDVIRQTLRINSSEGVRLVRGSHIVTKKLYNHDRAYIFQGGDGRIVFAIPYEEDFTLIGTTDRDHEDAPLDAHCTAEEAIYLCEAISEYLERPIVSTDVVWSYAGVRPLYDDGAKSATAATREYVLSLDEEGAPLLNVFGGKITTYRKLAEAALSKLSPSLNVQPTPWTAGVALPGGDFPVNGRDALVESLMSRHAFLSLAWATRLIKGYGTDAIKILEGMVRIEDLGIDFGATLTELEVVWLMQNEFARSAEDVVWRRTKLGLRLSKEQIARLNDWMAADGQDKILPAAE